MAEVESEEVFALRAYMTAVGVDHRVTSTVKHSQNTAAGFPSLHRADGTNGKGRAMDIAGKRSGIDTPELMAIFRAFEPVEPLLHELIYAGPEIEYNIKRGKRVKPYAQSNHHNHVHVAVPRGVFLAVGEPRPEPTTEPEDDDMPIPDETRVGTLLCTVPGCTGWWELTANGCVFTIGGGQAHEGHYFGSIQEKWMDEHRFEGQHFTAIGPRADGIGYRTWGHDGDTQIFYTFGPGIGPVPPH